MNICIFYSLFTFLFYFQDRDSGTDASIKYTVNSINIGKDIHLIVSQIASFVVNLEFYFMFRCYSYISLYIYEFNVNSLQ